MNNAGIKPTARKTHRKTRTGCRTCKTRKIKVCKVSFYYIDVVVKGMSKEICEINSKTASLHVTIHVELDLPEYRVMEGRIIGE